MTAILDLDRVAYVYGLRNKSLSSYFYVGSTCKIPEKRLQAHLSEVVNGYHSNKHFINKVNKIGINNVTLDVLEITDLRNRWQIEKDWIKKLLDEGHKLVNRVHNGIEFDLANKLTRDEYYKLCQFIDSPLFDNSNVIHICLKECINYLKLSGSLLQDYFDSDCNPIFNEPDWLCQLKQINLSQQKTIRVLHLS